MVRFYSKDLSEAMKKRLGVSAGNSTEQLSIQQSDDYSGKGHKLNIKPLSVNDAYTGRRFKTDKYREYAKHIASVLPEISIPKGRLGIRLTFGFSSAGSDADNPTKAFVDCLSKKYGFNDNRVFRYEIDKVLVNKGNEFILFDIFSADKDLNAKDNLKS